ncbi:NRAMP family divalent metal transporter [Adhaeretor mobilis]|uniref:Divalent metal cation transporter MntH n=1 Tax=Adhaeretor mobilis TaxID=1930276 RepID=A0A517MYK3_9BACT|nr:divalent metal cation transporter [Adhaeretor mobilis]QDS99954.1 Divalent metal cation transporter MntH [Adhaeretor mobilis]
MIQSLLRTFRSALPGLFLVGFTIGTGSVTSMVKAGADHGMSLLWALLLSCLASYVLFTAFGKLTAISRLTALQAIKLHIHPGVSLFILIALVVCVSGSIMGVMGIIAEVLEEWSTSWSPYPIPALVWAALISVRIVIALWRGNTKSFEVLLASLAGIMGVCFLANAALTMPAFSDIAAGFVPRIPQDTSDGNGSSGFLVAASMVGTTVAPIVLFFRSLLVREQNWSITDLKQQKRDAAISSVLIFVISGAIMASAAGSLHAKGASLQHAKEMIPLLKPLAGSLAVVIFVIGITAAGVSSQAPNVVAFAWLRRDYRGEGAEVTTSVDRWLVAGMATLGLVVPIFHARPVWIMLASQALGAVLLPTTVICLFYLLNKPAVMGEHCNRWTENIVLGLIVLFALVMAGIGCYGLLTSST